MKQKILVIVGPTASGKSSLAVELARKFGGEIISADSRQVYRGLDIGTGKITKREMKRVPHHVLDVVSPKNYFGASDFVEKARAARLRLAARHHLPIIVGGTGYYIDAFVGRIAIPNVLPNPKLRAQFEKKSAAQLFSLLKKRDPRRAKSLASVSERNNKVRLIRALEITAQLGRVPLRGSTSEFDVLWIGIKPPQKELERRIRTRLSARIRYGMIAEAKRLHAHGLSYKRMEELGLEYRSLAQLLQKKVSRKEFENGLFRDIRRYAKKQIAYWKRNRDIRWFESPTSRKIESTVRAWLA